MFVYNTNCQINSHTHVDFRHSLQWQQLITSTSPVCSSNTVLCTSVSSDSGNTFFNMTVQRLYLPVSQLASLILTFISVTHVAHCPERPNTPPSNLYMYIGTSVVQPSGTTCVFFGSYIGSSIAILRYLGFINPTGVFGVCDSFCSDQGSESNVQMSFFSGRPTYVREAEYLKGTFHIDDKGQTVLRAVF